MDFHSLTRRELQAFCKKNKIPANMTNAAMADALNALETVEGIEVFIQISQSETAESSIETLEGLEVTSPYAPATGGRSTRRRNVVKEEAESVTVTRTRRTARKTASKASDESQVDTVETPAVMAQTSRRKVQMSTACRKMDSELMECVEEEKKDVSMTSAASQGLTSRRKVPMPYSTRRSVRLAGKSIQMMNDVTSEGSELFKNEEVTRDSEEGQEVTSEGSELFKNEEVTKDSEEGQEVTSEGSELFENEVTKESEEGQEVNQKESLNNCAVVDEPTAIVEENCESEVKSEVVEVPPQNTEHIGGEDEVMPVYVSDEVQQSEVSEIEMSIEEDSKEKDIEIVAGDSTESKDNSAIDEVSHEEVFCDEAEQELHDDMDARIPEDVLVKLTELKLQQEDTQVVKVEGDGAEADSDDLIDHLAIPEQVMKTEPDEMETLILEESKQSADQEPSEAQPNVEEEAFIAVASVSNSPSKQSGVEDAPLNEAEQIPNKSSAVKSMTDNKENNIMEEKIEPAKDSGDNLEELSLRKLTKMFKELKLKKLESKHGNEATLPRTALQALPENRVSGGNEK